MPCHDLACTAILQSIQTMLNAMMHVLALHCLLCMMTCLCVCPVVVPLRNPIVRVDSEPNTASEDEMPGLTGECSALVA